MTRGRLAAAALVVAGLVPAACSDKGPGEGEARLEVDGRAVVERRGGDRDEVRDSADIHSGDRVELVEGSGSMLLHRGIRLELRAGLGDAADSALLMGTTPELEAGDLLVSAPRRLELVAAGTTLRIDGGAARVSRALGVAVAAYDAAVQVDSAGQVREVPGLREMQVPALGRPPKTARPLDYRAGDPWDRRFLGQAMELGDRLEAIAKGYTQNLDGREGRTPGFFRLVLPGLDDEPSFGAELIDLERAPGETLVGAAITDLGRRGTFVERWHSVFGFREEGAAWGLVVLDQDVSGSPLLGTIEEAVGTSPLAFVAPPAPGRSAPQTPGSTGPDGPVTPSPTPTTSPPTTSPPTTSPPPTTPPTTTPTVPENPLAPVLDPVLGPTTEVVTGLVGGLLGIG